VLEKDADKGADKTADMINAEKTGQEHAEADGAAPRHRANVRAQPTG
jgi:hypothetical protein